MKYERPLFIYMHRYDLQYEGGKCPLGHEYVSGYTDSTGKWHDAYCRKLGRRQPRKDRKMEQRQDAKYDATEEEYSFEPL